MNGRIEDSVTGRFLSADPHTPDRYNTQSWNRYSYVNNNPLSFIDPTGFDDCPSGASFVTGNASTSTCRHPIEEVVVTAERLTTTISVPPLLNSIVLDTQLQPDLGNTMDMGGSRTPLNNKGPKFGCRATIGGETCGAPTAGAGGAYCPECNKKSQTQPNPDNIPPNPDPPDLGDDDNSNNQINNPPDLRLSDSQKNNLAAGAFELFILSILAALLNPAT